MTYSRFSVVGFHLLLSAVILGLLISVMFVLWYPNGLFSVAGGWQGIKILAPIDLVLGPMLTLMFYKPSKPGVLRDLVVIGCVQIAALGYGMQAVYAQRPIALVFAEGEFIAITPSEADEANAELLKRDIQPIDPATLSDSSPPVVVARPISPENRAAYVASLFGDMPELALRSNRFERIDQHIDLLAESAVAPPKGEPSANTNWFALKTKFGTGSVQVDTLDARVVASISQKIDIKPGTQALETAPAGRDTVHITDGN